MIFSIIGKTYKVRRTDLKKVAQATFSVLGNQKGEIELIFVSKDKITSLNKSYRKINKVTDVLSFEIGSDPLLGQIFICYAKMVEQAKKMNVNKTSEAQRLLAHGLAHLYGYKHNNDKDSVKIKKVEEIILERVRK